MKRKKRKNPIEPLTPVKPEIPLKPSQPPLVKPFKPEPLPEEFPLADPPEEPDPHQPEI